MCVGADDFGGKGLTRRSRNQELEACGIRLSRPHTGRFVNRLGGLVSVCRNVFGDFGPTLLVLKFGSCRPCRQRSEKRCLAAPRATGRRDAYPPLAPRTTSLRSLCVHRLYFNRQSPICKGWSRMETNQNSQLKGFANGCRQIVCLNSDDFGRKGLKHEPESMLKPMVLNQLSHFPFQAECSASVFPRCLATRESLTAWAATA